LGQQQQEQQHQQQQSRPPQLHLSHQQQPGSEHHGSERQGSEQWEQLHGVGNAAGVRGLPVSSSSPSGAGLAVSSVPGVPLPGSMLWLNQQQQQSRQHHQQQVAAVAAGSGLNPSRTAPMSYNPLHSPGHHVLQLYPSTLYPGGPSAAAGLGLGSGLYPGRGIAAVAGALNPSLGYSRFQGGGWGAGSVVHWGLGGVASMAGSGASEFLPTNETDDLGSRLAVSHSMLQGFYESQDLTVQHRQQNRLHARSAMFFGAGRDGRGSSSGMGWVGHGVNANAAAGGGGAGGGMNDGHGGGGAVSDSMYIPPRPVWQ
jgi:hypothetical protein